MFTASTALFAAYMFLHTTTFQLASHGGAAYLTAAQQEALYYLHQAFAVLGFLSFAGSRRILRGARSRRALTASTLGVDFAGTAALFAAKSAFAYQYIAPVVILCLCYLGGLVYWRMAETLRGSDRMGAVMGGGCAIAYALQYPLQLWHGASLLLPVAMLAAFAVLGRLLLRDEATDAAQAGASAARDKKQTLSLACACAVTAALIMLNCFYDGYIEQMQTLTGYDAYNAFDWPRLLLIPGLLLFGFLGDVKRGKYLPLAVLCAIFVTLLNPVLTGIMGAYRLNMCLFYIGAAAAISYYNLTCWRLAPQTRCGELWAGMGRVIDAAVGTVLGVTHFYSLSNAIVIAADALALVLLIVAMALNGDLIIFHDTISDAAASEAPKPADDEARPARFAQRYLLTPKETAVLRELVLTDADQLTIADAMGIQVSTVQKHCNAIYRKTGAANRIELLRNYEDGRWDTDDSK